MSSAWSRWLGANSVATVGRLVEKPNLPHSAIEDFAHPLSANIFKTPSKLAKPINTASTGHLGNRCSVFAILCVLCGVSLASLKVGNFAEVSVFESVLRVKE